VRTKKILVVGAGRTSSTLIEYLQKQAEKQNWQITVADQSFELAKARAGKHRSTKPLKFNVSDDYQRDNEISVADIVVSLLPESLHVRLVKDCLRYKVHLVTASYVSDNMDSFHEQALKRNVVLLNEMGLDPGIDHMETMRLINEVKHKGGELTSLKSYGGGLVADESNDNPWGYKITWNPMNVVTAGMSSARYYKDGQLKVVPYNRLFLDTEIVEIPGLGKFESYPNRDSIKYKRIYHVPRIPNVYRGSLRRIGYCNAWNALVKLGITENRYIIPDSDTLTYNDFISIYLDKKNGNSTREELQEFLGEKPNSKVMQKIEWLELLSRKKIKIKNGTPAEILLENLKEKWEFKKNDKDMVILQTEVEYIIKKRKEKIISSLVVFGKDLNNTAMAATVGVPLGIGVNLILNNKIKERGVVIPIHAEIYKPALKELAEWGIEPKEKLEILR
jgi:saccharopine dehydrogenase-like NADP-dependent oxidoreductase